MIRVLLVDDHPAMCSGWRWVLNARAPSAYNFTDARSAEQALTLLSSEAFDLVILDFHLPGHNGLAVLQQIKKLQPKVAVLVVSISDEAEFTWRVLKQGANGYISKTA